MNNGKKKDDGTEKHNPFDPGALLGGRISSSLFPVENYWQSDRHDEKKTEL